MLIRYASAHRWVRPVPHDPLLSFGEHAVDHLIQTLPKIQTSDIRNETLPLANEFLDRFIPLYEERIHSKKHPVVFDIRDRTLIHPPGTRKYFSMSLFEGEQFIGGTIFSHEKQRLGVAYRTYDYAWHLASLRANPSLLTEYYLNEYAKKEGCKYIIHGKDRNPYGQNSNIGLAMFKLSVGCIPMLSKTYDIKTLNTEEVTEDIFVLGYPSETSLPRITEAYLITEKATYDKWIQTTKYPSRLPVTVIYRD